MASEPLVSLTLAMAEEECPLFMTRAPTAPVPALDALAALIDEDEEVEEEVQPALSRNARKRKSTGMGTMQVQLALSSVTGSADREVAQQAHDPSGKRRRPLRDRELQTTPRLSLPSVSDGVLVLDKVDLQRLPVRLLDAYRGERLHYIDLGGSRARSIADYGGDDAQLAHVTKLYASRCQLRSLAGLERFVSLRYLYLDRNELTTEALAWDGADGARHSLLAADYPEHPDEIVHARSRWSPHRLETLDLTGNAIAADLSIKVGANRLLALKWLNGERLPTFESSN